MMASRHGRMLSSDEQLVASTEIARNFGSWQEKSSKRPVYILHHGRPRSVLMSVDLYGRLLAGQGNQTAREEQLRTQADILLANMERMCVLADRELQIIRINRAAATFLGKSARTLISQPLSALFPEGDGKRIASAAYEAMKSGLPQRLVFKHGNQFEADIVPFPPGVGLFWSDVTDEREHAARGSEREGAETLLGMMTGCAVGEIHADGMLASVHPTLKRLLRFPQEMIARTPFADLFDEGSRRRCRLHLAHVLDGKGPVRCRADIVTRDRDAVPVRLFLAPKIEGTAVTTVFFSLLDDALGALPMR